MTKIPDKKNNKLPETIGYPWNMVMANAEYGNQMCLQMTSNSSTRAFNEITSLNEHWERVKSEQWLFRVV